jgi:predicted nucleic acid binding AN1-type Zn finger protein
MEVINTPSPKNIIKTPDVPKKKKKSKISNKCPYISNNEKCSNKISLIVGECNYCKKVFCLTHRYPEAHNCPNLSDLKEKKYTINKNLLLSQKCNEGQVKKI